MRKLKRILRAALKSICARPDAAVIGRELKTTITVKALTGDRFRPAGEEITLSGGRFVIYISKRGEDISLTMYGNEDYDWRDRAGDAWDDQRFMLTPSDREYDDEQDEDDEE